MIVPLRDTIARGTSRLILCRGFRHCRTECRTGFFDSLTLHLPPGQDAVISTMVVSFAVGTYRSRVAWPIGYGRECGSGDGRNLSMIRITWLSGSDPLADHGIFLEDTVSNGFRGMAGSHCNVNY